MKFLLISLVVIIFKVYSADAGGGALHNASVEDEVLQSVGLEKASGFSKRVA